MAISKEVLQELLKEYQNPEDLLGENGILKELTKALVESALGAELTDHLGYQKHENGEKGHANRRNGSSKKTVRSDQGSISRFLAPVRRPSSRRWWQSTNGRSRDSATRFSRCMPGG